VKISPAKFEQLVADGLQLIPAELRRYIDNVAIVVEDQPSDALCEQMGLAEDETLYGLYTGTPLTERSVTGEPLLPDRITIYRRPLLEDFDDPDEIRDEIARTVIHEVAHHFGIDDERLAELGWD
jgi:predicted Zn-dependent protease with MMP-like domain